MRQFIVIGLDELGYNIATTLAKSGFDVIAIDKDLNLVEQIKDEVTKTVQMDPSDEDSMAELDLRSVDAAVVNLIDDFESAVLSVSILKKLGIKEIIATAQNEIKGKILALSGATKIIYSQREMGLRIAKSLIAPKLTDIISLSVDHSLSQISTPKKFIGKTLSEIGFRTKYKLNIVGIKKQKIDPKTNELKEEINHLPTANDILEEGDILIIIGSDVDIEKISCIE